jgi:hypothetical protein
VYDFVNGVVLVYTKELDMRSGSVMFSDDLLIVSSIRI